MKQGAISIPSSNARRAPSNGETAPSGELIVQKVHDGVSSPDLDPSFVTHVVGDQSAVTSFFSDPLNHGLDPLKEQVQRIDTVGSLIFLAGDKAYKVKRAVCFPYMDFSTLARREEACRAEILINRPTAPEIYIDVVAITRDGSGNIALNGSGEAIEWAVAMRRFDTSHTFDQLAEHGELTDSDLERATDALISFCRRAPERRAADWYADLSDYIERNDQGFHEAGGLFEREAVRTLSDRSLQHCARYQELLTARGFAHKVRRCHGDLHLRNLVRLREGVRLFDAIEFDDRLATGDMLYDLAFLLMDFDRSGLRHEANTVLNHYLMRQIGSSDLEALAALPLFLSLRAAHQARVLGQQVTHLSGRARARVRDKARDYFNYAIDMLEPRDVFLTVIGGLSGTGKSTVARALAPSIGRSPGAIILRSDVVRKRLLKVSLDTVLGDGDYGRELTQEVFETLNRLARTALEAGHSVIVDGVFAREEERAAIENIARMVDCRFASVWLEANVQTRLERVDARLADESDTNSDVAQQQEMFDTSNITWPRVSSEASLESTLAKVRPLVDRLN
ncbi:MAG: AAA family ATPase [Pseudomonadota bacterium]